MSRRTGPWQPRVRSLPRPFLRPNGKHRPRWVSALARGGRTIRGASLGSRPGPEAKRQPPTCLRSPTMRPAMPGTASPSPNRPCPVRPLPSEGPRQRKEPVGGPTRQRPPRRRRNHRPFFRPRRNRPPLPPDEPGTRVPPMPLHGGRVPGPRTWPSKHPIPRRRPAPSPAEPPCCTGARETPRPFPTQGPGNPKPAVNR